MIQPWAEALSHHFSWRKKQAGGMRRLSVTDCDARFPALQQAETGLRSLLIQQLSSDNLRPGAQRLQFAAGNLAR